MTDAPRRRARAAPPPAGRQVGDILFLLAICATGAWSAWPVYADAWFLVVAGAAVVVAIALALVATRRGWGAGAVAAWLAGAYLVLGVALAMPFVREEPAQLPSALLKLVTAPVTGWKDLLTLQLPLGTYQATLAPALLLFLLVPTLALAFAWRTERLWVLAAPTALLLPLFGILFGTSAVAGTLTIGPVVLTGLTQLAVGLVALLAALGWSVWRLRSARAAALRRARAASDAHIVRHRGAATGRWSAAGGLVLIATLVGVVAAPLAVAGHTRDVLRTATDPDLRVRTALSPSRPTASSSPTTSTTPSCSRCRRRPL